MQIQGLVVCVCVCEWVDVREKDIEMDANTMTSLVVCVSGCECVCVRERGR
jgi:hypothetical protein